MSWLTMSSRELLDALDKKQISPSKIIGNGYKSSVIARKLAREYLLEQIDKERERAMSIYDDQDLCRECGAHFSDPHDPQCANGGESE